MARDLPCVFRAASIGEADIIVAWLEEQGIRAMVQDEHSAVMLWVPRVTAPWGVEVCVVDPRKAEEAKRLIEHHIAERDAARAESGGGVVPVVCEECGHQFELPAVERGTVQRCPGCRAYVDVPTLTDDPSRF